MTQFGRESDCRKEFAGISLKASAAKMIDLGQPASCNYYQLSLLPRLAYDLRLLTGTSADPPGVVSAMLFHPAGFPSGRCLPEAITA